MGTQGIPMTWEEAMREAQLIANRIKPICPNIRIAGSIRRLCPIVNDIDLLLITPDGKLPWQLSYEFVCPSFGNYKATCILPEGYQIDFMACTQAALASSLLYFTGSADFNRRMRGKAKALGFMLSEYGLYNGTVVQQYVTEQEIFQALGMNYVPPELRD